VGERPSEWVVRPGAGLEMELRAEADLGANEPPGPAIFIMGNRHGLVSPGSELPWRALGGDGIETLYISGLPCARVEERARRRSGATCVEMHRSTESCVLTAPTGASGASTTSRSRNWPSTS